MGSQFKLKIHIQVISCEAMAIRRMVIIGCSLFSYYSIIKLTFGAQLVQSAVRHKHISTDMKEIRLPLGLILN